MSLSKTAKATRAVLKEHADEAYEGTLTTGQVLDYVHELEPDAKDAGIYNAIGSYGPDGEEDHVWARRAKLGLIPNRFYNPKTGESLD